MAKTIRLFLAGLAVAGAATVVPASTNAQAAGTYRIVGTGGAGLRVRTAPNTSASTIKTLGEGTSHYVECQVEYVTAPNGVRSHIWNRSEGGVSSDLFWSTPNVDRFSMERCGGTPTDGRAEAAIRWFESRMGSTAYEGWCERAVENAYGTSGRYSSANANWNAQVQRGAAHPGNMSPPRGALAYWDQWRPYGHVGISLGDGRFIATSVNGRIGIARLPYYSGYRGWSAVPF